MSHYLKAQQIEQAFQMLEAAAVAGMRCPADKTQGGSLPDGAVSELWRRGKIKSEVSGRNFRQITILVGPHAGKKTAPNPEGHVVWKINGRSVLLPPEPQDAGLHQRVMNRIDRRHLS